MLSDFLSLNNYTTQDHKHEGDSIHSGPGLLRSANESINCPTDLLKVNVMEKISQLEVACSLMTLACVKLTK